MVRRTLLVHVFLFVSCSLACPVRLVEIVSTSDANMERAGKDDGLALTEKGLQYLVKQKSPLYIVPSLGVYRGGKSLLLNRIMGLTAPYDTGFGVGHSQRSHTKGIDICAESVEDVGTIIWMDTEGLWSSEGGHGLYGPKLFCLALLFASLVLLNSIKVLSDHFFAFFAEQQQVSRVLREGLHSEGLPEDYLLPNDLSIVWVLQQPIEYNNCTQDSQESCSAIQQLHEFLERPDDELRARMYQDFSHQFHEVPMAVYDTRLWDRLDQLSDDDLLPEYVESARNLRSIILKGLPNSQPLHASTVSMQLQLYVELVNKSNFRGEIAKEMFEKKQINNISDQFEREVSNIVGALPAFSSKVQSAFEAAHHGIEPLITAAANSYHFDNLWIRHLNESIDQSKMEFNFRNSEEVLAQWQVAAGAISEEGGCFFLDQIAELQQEYQTFYDTDFHKVQEQADIYSRRLQRTRLLECVKMRDILWPLSPWLVWPFCSIYMMGGTFSSLGTMTVHASTLFVVYIALQFFQKLPDYLDINYPILKESKMLLDLVMRAPPQIPWNYIAMVVAFFGLIWSSWNIMKRLYNLCRPPGQSRAVEQMLNLELKINRLQKSSDAIIKQQMIAAVMDVVESLEQNELRHAYRTLLKFLSFACELDEESLEKLGAPTGFKKYTRQFLRKKYSLPPRNLSPTKPPIETSLESIVIRGENYELLGEILRLTNLLSELGRKC